MNSKIVCDYMMQSSDSRSFPIRPRVKIPKFDRNDTIHNQIVKICKKAHDQYGNGERILQITEELSRLYMSIV